MAVKKNNNVSFEWMTVLVICLVFVSDVPNVDAIGGGQAVNRCDYPGLAVVISQTNALLCTGVIIGDSMYMPKHCGTILSIILGSQPLEVRNEKYKWIIPKSTPFPGVTVQDGINLIKLDVNVRSDLNTADCFQDGVLYDGMEDLDTSTCEVVGYGAATNDGVSWSVNNLHATQIVKSTSSPCCEMIKDTFTKEEQGIGFMLGGNVNCLTASGATCGLGDLGAPVMCNTVSGVKVTIGLTISNPCVFGGAFLVEDVTGSTPKTKFGIKAIA